MRRTNFKTPVLSAVAFFGTLGILSVGYSAYVSSYPATATAGTSQLSSTEWNKMVTALQTLDTNLSSFTISSGNVGIGTAPNSKLSVNGNIATMGYGIVGKNLWTAPVTWAFIAGNVGSNDGGYGLFYGSNAINGADDRRGNVDIGSYAVGGTPGKINFLSYNGTGWNTNMVIQPNGYVGIGTTAPTQKLDVNGNIGGYGTIIAGNGPLQSIQAWPDIGGYVNLVNSAKTAAGTANVWSIYNMGGSYGNSLQFYKYDKVNPCAGGMCNAAFKIFDAGDAWIQWTLTQSSDERLKTGIRPLEGSLGKILSLRGVTYSWKDPNASKKRQVGLIAQDVEKQFPELVATDENGMKSVAYSNLVAPLVEAVKEQQKEIEALKDEVRNLKNR